MRNRQEENEKWDSNSNIGIRQQFELLRFDLEKANE